MALDPMKGMIASYLASPQGKQSVNSYLASPEGKRLICEYLATPQGKETVRTILPCILDALDLSAEDRARIAESVQKRT